jgi:hypothetical protein
VAVLQTPKEVESNPDNISKQKEFSPSPVSPSKASPFRPVAESYAEIMTPGRALLDITNGCQHRLGRKSGKSCISCTYEKKTHTTMQHVLQITPSRRAVAGGEFQNGTTRIPFQKLCHGLRHFKAETSVDLDAGTGKEMQVNQTRKEGQKIGNESR